MNENNFSEDSIRYIEYLSQLLSFGVSEIQTKTDKPNYSHLQNFLLFSFIPINNYCEAILLLCKDSRPHSASVLLRSIFEAYMNIKYIESTDTEKRLALFAKGSFKSREKLLKRFEELLVLYPKLKDKSVMMKKDNLTSHKDFVDKHIQAINLGNELEEEENYEEILLKRVQQLDKEEQGDKAGTNELSYRTMYVLLSQYTHLGPWGLELFVEQSPKSIIYTLGKSSSHDELIGQTYLFYFELLSDLYEKKVLAGEMPDIYKTWFTELEGDLLK